MSSVFVVGGYGFLGSHIFNAFQGQAIRSKERGFHFSFDTVINASGRTAGISENKEKPAYFYMENLVSGTQIMEAARVAGVKKFVQIGTVCSYPKTGTFPMQESDFWKGYPEETNAAYGLAKKTLIVQAQAYAKQYKFNAICPILANLYGPGDHYTADKSHVIPALIVQFVNAQEQNLKYVTLWGSGQCSRDFLFVEDAAEAIKLLTEKYDSPEIINVASGREVKIRDLAESVASACGYRGEIRWDSSYPDGQPRRCFDTQKIAKYGWTAKTSLKNGISLAIADYKAWRLDAVEA